MKRFILLPLFLLLFLVASCGRNQDKEDKLTIRAGHFPDIVHAQAMVGKERGTFKEKLGPGVTINWKLFNAGPSAIEALFAGELDLTYIGPNPAINGYLKSGGKALRIVCGAASGGAGLVVRNGAGIHSTDDLHGKKIATPQLGNTQDVACRNWLKENGFVLTEKGGDVQVIPISNPDQLTLFITREIDAAWTKEPWVARLINEGNGDMFLDERSLWPEGKFVTAHIIVSTPFLQKHPRLVRQWIAAHVELTEWINRNPAEARVLINSEVKKITGKALPAKILEDAFSRTTLTYDPIVSSLITSAGWAFEAGFLGEQRPDLSSIYDLSLLNDVLAQKNYEPVPVP
jgi:NitT/TauT family transport system substrate-binding protein